MDQWDWPVENTTLSCTRYLHRAAYHASASLLYLSVWFIQKALIIFLSTNTCLSAVSGETMCSYECPSSPYWFKYMFFVLLGTRANVVSRPWLQRTLSEATSTIETGLVDKMTRLDHRTRSLVQELRTPGTGTGERVDRDKLEARIVRRLEQSLAQRDAAMVSPRSRLNLFRCFSHQPLNVTLYTNEAEF